MTKLVRDERATIRANKGPFFRLGIATLDVYVDQLSRKRKCAAHYTLIDATKLNNEKEAPIRQNFHLTKSPSPLATPSERESKPESGTFPFSSFLTRTPVVAAPPKRRRRKETQSGNPINGDKESVRPIEKDKMPSLKDTEKKSQWADLCRGEGVAFISVEPKNPKTFPEPSKNGISVAFFAPV